jgi:hypothetical protein
VTDEKKRREDEKIEESEKTDEREKCDRTSNSPDLERGQEKKDTVARHLNRHERRRLTTQKRKARLTRQRQQARVNSNDKNSRLTMDHDCFEMNSLEEICAYLDIGEDEEVDEFELMITTEGLPRKLQGLGDTPKWVEAGTKEECRVKGYGTFGGPLSPDEVKRVRASGEDVIPIVCIYTRKRDDSYKCRSVYLGNRATDLNLESYSSVVGQGPIRYHFYSAAREKEAIGLFDISNAYLHAELEKIFWVCLPKEWREKGETGVRRLLKALYGKKESGRDWQKLLSAFLVEQGYTASAHADCSYRKASSVTPGKWIKLSIYVDDCAISAPTEGEVKLEQDIILKRFPGRIIEPKDSELTLRDETVISKTWDVLGADVNYSQKTGRVLISLSDYILKMTEKHDPQWRKERDGGKAKKVDSPCFYEKDIHDGPLDEDKFDVRGCVGQLIWCVTVCRPDVAMAVSTLSKLVSKPPTKSYITAIRKVMRYLYCTKDRGVGYSPEQEKDFTETYSKLLNAEFDKLPTVNAFGDAGFANQWTTMNSTSGGLILWHGAQITWRCKAQTIRTYSSTESEYVSCSDLITLSATTDYLGWFENEDLVLETNEESLDDNPPNRILWQDNTSAISTAKSSDTRPKSRHFALRWSKVRDYSRALCYCPTKLMAADALTKLGTQREIKEMVLLHHIIPCEQEREETTESKSWCVPYVDEKGHVRVCTIMEEETDLNPEEVEWDVEA